MGGDPLTGAGLSAACRGLSTWMVPRPLDQPSGKRAAGAWPWHVAVARGGHFIGLLSCQVRIAGEAVVGGSRLRLCGAKPGTWALGTKLGVEAVAGTWDRVPEKGTELFK